MFRRRRQEDSPLSNPGVIDLVADSPDGSTFGLCMVETRPWKGGKGQIDELQAKVNSYLSYILDGQLEREYPDSVRQRKAIIVMSVDPPPSDIIEIVERGLARYEVGFEAWPLTDDNWPA